MDFDNFLQKNSDIISKVKPLSSAEVAMMQTESRFGFKTYIKDELGNRTFNPVIYHAKEYKSKGKCPVLGSCNVVSSAAKKMAYFNFAFKDRPKKAEPIKKKKQLMDLDDAKKKFWLDYLSKSVPNKQYLVDDNNRHIISNLLKYFIWCENGLFSLDKGILVFGPVGVGKTHLMEQFSKFTNDLDLPTKFNIVSMRTEVNPVANKEGLHGLKQFYKNDIMFDDIAVRDQIINNMGTKIMPLDEIINGRYNRFKNKNTRPTHFTSNINFKPTTNERMQELLKVYDMRTIDRMQEMCNFVYYGGKSKRQ